jgi:hypothetical protein
MSSNLFGATETYFHADEGSDHTIDALSAGPAGAGNLRDPDVAGSYESQVYKNIVSDVHANLGSRRPVHFSDPSNAYANSKKIVLSFYPLIAGHNINFKAFITSFTDNYTSDWAEEMVFGRNDPIYSFKSTKRSISLSFELIAATRIEAVRNLSALQYLIKALYPAYSGLNKEIASLTKSPLVKMKFANLISDHSTAGGASFNSYKGGTAKAQTGGLLGVIKSLTVTPNFDVGAYDGPGPSTVYPKLIEVSLDFGVIHQSILGHNNSNRWPGSSGHFPYGASTPAYVDELRGVIADAQAESHAWTRGAQAAEAALRMTEGDPSTWSAPYGETACKTGEAWKWSTSQCVDVKELESREAQEAEILAVRQEVTAFLESGGQAEAGSYISGRGETERTKAMPESVE